MPIQIPSLQRFQPQEEPSVGRLLGQAPDLASAMQLESKAVSHLASTGIDVAEKIQANQLKQELLSADTAADEAVYDFHTKMTDKLLEAKNIKGDPAATYAGVNQYEDKLFQDKIEKYKNTSPLTQALINKKLKEAKFRIYDRKAIAQSAQQTEWELGVKENSLKMDRENIGIEMGFANRADPNSFNTLNDAIKTMASRITTYGAKVGRQPDDPAVVGEIAKHLNDGLKDGIELLISSKKIDAAKYAYETYSKNLTTDNRRHLTDLLMKGDINRNAAQEFDKLYNLPEEDAIKKANTDIKDPEVRIKTIEDLHSYATKMKEIGKQKHDRNLNLISDRIIQQKLSNDPFLDANSMWKDPIIEKLANNLSPSDRKVVESMVEGPRKKSDEATVVDLLTLHTTQKLADLSPTEFLRRKSKLDATDARTFQGYYERAKVDTESEQRTRESSIHGKLITRLTNMGFISDPKYGAYSDDDKKKLLFINEELGKNFIDINKTSIPEQEKWVVDMAARIKGSKKPGFFEEATQKIKAFFGGEDYVLPPSTTTTTQAPQSATAPVVVAPVIQVPPALAPSLSAFSAPTKAKIYRMYLKEHGGKDPTPEQFEKYLQEQAK